MAFLDNSGDIILDAVLTDTGRLRLAKGDGTFTIVKFALGDDEIDYRLYDTNVKTAAAALTVLQTPILEAFANNRASMKSTLLSIARDNLLYLPIIRLNENGSSALFGSGTAARYIVAVDKTTVDDIVPDGTTSVPAGVLNGYQPGPSMYLIRADQGLNTDAISQDTPLDADLNETQFMVQMDNRLGGLVNPVNQSATPATLSFVDDDNIASYILTLNTDSDYVEDLPAVLDSTNGSTSILGPTGSRIMFKIAASTSLRTSSYLFNKLGNTGTEAIGSMGAADYKYIDTTISITGQTTGYRLDVPVRYVKKI